MVNCKREAGAAILSLFLISCATVETIKTEVKDRLPTKQTEQVLEDEASIVADTTPVLSAEEQLVTRIQESLNSLGYSAGPTNGRLGAKTEAAIQDFQLDSGLRIDGKPTQELLDLLKRKVASS